MNLPEKFLENPPPRKPLSKSSYSVSFTPFPSFGLANLPRVMIEPLIIAKEVRAANEVGQHARGKVGDANASENCGDGGRFGVRNQCKCWGISRMEILYSIIAEVILMAKKCFV